MAIEEKLSHSRWEGSARTALSHRRPPRRPPFRCQHARPSATAARKKAPPPSIAQAELPFKLLHNRLVALGQWTLDGRPLLSSPFCLPLLPLPEAPFLPSHIDTHALSSAYGSSVGPLSLTSPPPWSLEDPEARPAPCLDTPHNDHPPRSFF